MKRTLNLILAASLLAAACGQADAGPEPGTPAGDDAVFVDDVQILLLESWPVQVRAVVRGHLPTPCHTLGWRLGEPGPDGRIRLDLFSTVDDADEACILVLERFEESIDIGSLAAGDYVLVVNGTDYPISASLSDQGTDDGSPGDDANRYPGPGDPLPSPGGSTPSYVDEVELLLMESWPVQVRAIVRGHLPTPCHTLGWLLGDPDADGRIQLDVFSTPPGDDVACIQVLEPFEESIDIGSFETGDYLLVVNGVEYRFTI